MEMNTVFVVVVTYNGKQWYKHCFESLRSSIIPIHIIAVDNASSDNTVNYINSNFPEVHVIKSAINLGFGQANNLAIKYALNNKADYIFLLNQDAWIEPNVIAGLIDIHKSNLQYGILSPMHLNAQKNQIERGLAEFIANYNITPLDLINDMYFNRIQDLYETKYVNAAAWLLPRIILETIGGFDPIFFHYGEDDNYMHRVLYHGFKIGICPKYNIVHDTENRVKASKESKYSFFKFLLVDCTNINKESGVEQLILYHFRKSIINILKFNIQYFRDNLSLMIKFILYRKAIYNSRRTNFRIGAHWIKHD
jgi:GT2 family glycosyltransferase